MQSEWLVDVPDDFNETYFTLPCPVGKRCLVVTSDVSCDLIFFLTFSKVSSIKCVNTGVLCQNTMIKKLKNLAFVGFLCFWGVF